MQVESSSGLLEGMNRWQHIGLVLAAGQGRRFGMPKAAAVIDGERLIDRAVRVLRQGGCPRVVVVLGAWVGAVADAEVIVNPDWPTGMGSTLHCGLGHLSRDMADGRPQGSPRRAVVTLVDLPGITPAAVRHLCQHPQSLVAAQYEGQQGHPVLIAEHHWPALMRQLSGDSGARQYLRDQAATLISLDAWASGSDLDVPPLTLADAQQIDR